MSHGSGEHVPVLMEELNLQELLSLPKWKAYTSEYFFQLPCALYYNPERKNCLNMSNLKYIVD